MKTIIIISVILILSALIISIIDMNSDIKINNKLYKKYNN